MSDSSIGSAQGVQGERLLCLMRRASAPAVARSGTVRTPARARGTAARSRVASMRARRSARVHYGFVCVSYELQRVHNNPVKALIAVLVVLAPLKAPFAPARVVRAL